MLDLLIGTLSVAVLLAAGSAAGWHLLSPLPRHDMSPQIIPSLFASALLVSFFEELTFRG